MISVYEIYIKNKKKKRTVLDILVIGVGHKQEITDLTTFWWWEANGSALKEKKEKKNSSFHMGSYPLVSRFLNIVT